jgi:hypothetical protein
MFEVRVTIRAKSQIDYFSITLFSVFIAFTAASTITVAVVSGSTTSTTFPATITLVVESLFRIRAQNRIEESIH